MKKIRNTIIILLTLLLISVIILIIVVALNRFKNNENNDSINEGVIKNPDFWNIQIVKDANDFYTVSSCVDKFLSFWYMQDKKETYKILENKYKEENAITEENVFEKIGNLPEMLTFRPKKMYYINIEQSIQKYYVYGTTRADTMEERGIESDYYVEVILNFNNETFSIRPSLDEEFPNSIV